MDYVNKARIAISTLNSVRNTGFAEIKNNPGVFKGNVALKNECVSLLIDCTKGFPYKFPIVKIENAKQFYPHVDNEGTLCLIDDTSLLIRSDLYEQIMIDAFDRAISILEIDPKSPEYKTEIAREFNAYWSQDAQRFIYANLSSCNGNEYKELKCISVDELSVVSDSISDSEYLLKYFFSKDLTNRAEITCMLIRLREFEVLPIQKEYSWRGIRNFILKNVTASQKNKFHAFLRKRLKELNRYIILSVPHNGRDFYIGIWVHYRERNYCVVEKSLSCKVEPIMIIPIDNSYMINRGGGQLSLKDKSVLLIGCGSVGGFIASDLCQCGIGSIDLIDKDILSPDNIHRHILGFKDAIKRQNKAVLMKNYLEEHYPYANLDALSYKEKDAWYFVEEPNRLSSYDLIISATGEPTLNLAINNALYENNISVPFIVCFNEPYGIGGHAMVVNIHGGCLRCLYTDIISNELTEFRCSLVDSNQDFRKSLSGCMGSFVEYSTLDSQQTALLSMRLALQVLKGECNKNTLISWVGSSQLLISNGYKVSEYYHRIETQQEHIITKQIDKNKRCVLCRNQKSV